mmetsp:Transcript_18058/g.54435  ORF Transcript_18058/g.54435 Transcript_18058/m.54435 type:complete len:220 (+) Transcript_18058:249-908(+)
MGGSRRADQKPRAQRTRGRQAHDRTGVCEDSAPVACSQQGLRAAARTSSAVSALPAPAPPRQRKGVGSSTSRTGSASALLRYSPPTNMIATSRRVQRWADQHPGACLAQPSMPSVRGAAGRSCAVSPRRDSRALDLLTHACSRPNCTHMRGMRRQSRSGGRTRSRASSRPPVSGIDQAPRKARQAGGRAGNLPEATLRGRLWQWKGRVADRAPGRRPPG